MLKFIRKYQLWILVIGGSLLMVAWLVPAGFQQALANPQGPVIGRLGDVKIRDGDRARASIEMDIVQRIDRDAMRRLGVDPTDPLHWILLKHEAQRLGLMPGDQAADDAIAALLPDEFVDSVAAGIRSSPTDVRLAIRTYMGIQSLFNLIEQSPKLSDVRGRRLARELGDQVIADLLFIEGDRARGEIPPPTEEDILAHYEAYKNTPPGGGEFGIGYAQQPRVKIEWLALRRGDIRAGVKIDPIESYKRWSTNRARYPGDFEAEQARVEEDLTNAMVDDAMQRAHLRISAEVKRALDRLPQVEGRFRELPPNWAEARPTMHRLAQIAAEAASDRRASDAESTITMQPPPVESRTEKWLTMQDMWSLVDLASARVSIGAMQYPLPAIIFAIREVDPTTPLGVQAGVPMVDYAGVDAMGNRFYVMVTDARPQGPPDSIEEVREQVVKDIKRLRGFERLKGELDAYRTTAVSDGLAAVAALFAPTEGSDSEPLRVLEGVTIGSENIQPASIEQWPLMTRLDHPVIRQKVIAAALTLDPLMTPESLDPEKTTLAIEIPQRQAVSLVRIKRLRPATIEYYRLGGDVRAMQAEQRRMIEGIDFAEWPYSRQRLEQRLNWTPVRRDASGEEM